uniref:Neuronal regeneration-related protein n=2 Tax=Homininae TaxID=207598 RepID=D6REJ5_HUMAN
MVYYPELFVWVSQEPFPNKDMEGRLPKETSLSPFMES